MALPEAGGPPTLSRSNVTEYCVVSADYELDSRGLRSVSTESKLYQGPGLSLLLSERQIFGKDITDEVKSRLILVDV